MMRSFITAKAYNGSFGRGESYDDQQSKCEDLDCHFVSVLSAKVSDYFETTSRTLTLLLPVALGLRQWYPVTCQGTGAYRNDEERATTQLVGSISRGRLLARFPPVAYIHAACDHVCRALRYPQRKRCSACSFSLCRSQRPLVRQRLLHLDTTRKKGALSSVLVVICGREKRREKIKRRRSYHSLESLDVSPVAQLSPAAYPKESII